MSCRAISAALVVHTLLNVSQPLVQAQAIPRPEFEVASIKPAPAQDAGHTSTNMNVHTSGDGRNGSLSYTNVSVKEVLGQAYKIQQYQISGGPSWLESERFDIAAIIPAGSSQDQIMLMLQNLLADRFQLVLHRETKPLPVYALTVGKNGLKIKPVESGNDISSNSSRTRWHVNAKTSMPRFAEFLSVQLDRPVLDDTGLSGAFEITLDWTVDTVEQPGANDTASGPSIFTAVQEQLGLKLEARKGPVEILVVDRVERPSGN
jgi:uncharacterized protein (TIGR03435 family)